MALQVYRRILWRGGGGSKGGLIMRKTGYYFNDYESDVDINVDVDVPTSLSFVRNVSYIRRALL